MLAALSVGLGCSNGQHDNGKSDTNAATAGSNAADATTEGAGSGSSPCATRPLTEADVALYASVMHAAADRWAHLPADDRAALAAAKSIEAQGSTPDPSTIASMADRLQRASEIKTSMDRVIARERHIPLDCYDALAGRIEAVVPDPTTMASGSPGDAAEATPTPDERARQAVTRQQETVDSAVVAPRRTELQPLIHEIRLAHLAG